MVDSVGDIVSENAGEGTDTVIASLGYTLSNNAEKLVLTGGAAINAIGNALDNTLTGNAAANVLDGGAGADTMLGGMGDDTYMVDNANDVVTEYDGEYDGEYDEGGGAGTDSVQASITYTLGANVENLVLTGNAAINGSGNALDNILTGNGAANILAGDAGNDTLDGGAGADTLIGGTGDDTYVADNVGDVITEAANAGTDTVQASISHTLGANVENLTLTGNAAINGSGNALNNVLAGNSAANVLSGGAGNDTYLIDDAADSVVENANAGTDSVQAGITYTLGANVENLTLTGNAAINGSGNALNNVLAGNSAANVLSGGAGNDTYLIDAAADSVVENTNAGTDTVKASIGYTLGANVENLTLTGATAIDGNGNALNNVLTGNGAANVLDGGAGADTLQGGAGDDTYVVDNVADRVTENAGEGTDLIRSSVSHTIAANVENLVLTGTAAINGSGNALNNVLTGNSAANTLDGGAGYDTMYGGAGDDTYVVDNEEGEYIGEAGNEGIDTVQASVAYTLGDNLENLTLTGAAAINGTGNRGNNILIGNAADNVLDGGGGDDTLAGGAGSDTLSGGEGSDTYRFNKGDGADTVSDYDYSIGNTDTDIASFSAGIRTDQLWFRHVADNLEVSIIGTSDKLSIESWYSGSWYHVERFSTADNKLLLDSDVEKLVQAMAAFAPPAAGQTTLPQNYQDALAPAIAANWR